MIIIKNTGNHSYKLGFDRIQILNRTVGDALVVAVSKNSFKEGNLLIDMDGIIDVTSDGFKSLYEVMNITKYKYCRINFTNVADPISEMVNNLTYVSDG